MQCIILLSCFYFGSWIGGLPTANMWQNVGKILAVAAYCGIVSEVLFLVALKLGRI